MWVMKSIDKRELDAYRALGTVEELKARLSSPYPDDDDLAPLPFSDDPAQASVEAYEDEWDDRVYPGLLCEEA